jgi:pyridoxamine 5'-phosphate oxidase
VETPLQTECEIRQRIWQELQRATQDRHHAWRTPVLATIGRDGTPQARTVVLRHVDASSACIGFYTDSRSPKMSELIARPHASFVFWGKLLNWQIRVRANMSIQTSGLQVDDVWDGLRQSPAAGDYLALVAPGAAIDGASTQKACAGSQHHLAIVVAKVQALDWLELARTGHRRAVLTDTSFEWRVP